MTPPMRNFSAARAADRKKPHPHLVVDVFSAADAADSIRGLLAYDRESLFAAHAAVRCPLATGLSRRRSPVGGTRTWSGRINFGHEDEHMRIGKLMLAGTGLAALAMASGATAQQAADGAVPQACLDAGYQTVEECQAAGAAPAAPQPDPGTDAAPPADAVPEAPAPVEQPPADAPVTEAPQQPAPPPEAVEAQPAPAPEQPVEQPAPAPAPVPQEPQPAPAPAETEQPVPAPQPVPEAPVDGEPVTGQPAPEPVPVAPPPADAAPVEQPVPAEPAPAPVPAPAPDTGAQDAVPAPALGQPAEPVPADPATGAAPAAPEAVPGTEAQPEQQPAAPVNDEAVQVVATPEAAEAVEVLPEGTDPAAAAPVLDSVKDASSGVAPAVEVTTDVSVTVDPNAPVPESDATAQAPVAVDPATVTSVVAIEGTPIDQAPQFAVPENVTVIDNSVEITNVTVENAVIYEADGQVMIRNPYRDRERLLLEGDTVYYEDVGGGMVRETVTRADGSRVVTVRNRYGDIVRRSRITPDNQEYILAYVPEDRFGALVEFRDPAAGLPPLRLTISASEYVLDAALADAYMIEAFFTQPPVDQVYRIYSVDEVKRSARVRDTVRRVELGDLTFATDSAQISREQAGVLSNLATAINALLARNPGETFLIEGHTDAVGDDVYNLALSDARAAAVATALTQFYGVPPENLATQGYGERYLKVRTDGPAEANRRVTVRRITPLVSPVAQN